MSEGTTRPQDWYRHVDDCEQCLTQPFELCPVGAFLLNEAATELTNRWGDLFEVK